MGGRYISPLAYYLVERTEKPHKNSMIVGSYPMKFQHRYLLNTRLTAALTTAPRNLRLTTRISQRDCGYPVCHRSKQLHNFRVF